MKKIFKKIDSYVEMHSQTLRKLQISGKIENYTKLIQNCLKKIIIYLFVVMEEVQPTQFILRVIYQQLLIKIKKELIVFHSIQIYLR